LRLVEPRRPQLDAAEHHLRIEQAGLDAQGVLQGAARAGEILGSDLCGGELEQWGGLAGLALDQLTVAPQRVGSALAVSPSASWAAPRRSSAAGLSGQALTASRAAASAWFLSPLASR